MREHIGKSIDRYLDGHCVRTGMERIWKAPLVKFADARRESMGVLRELVIADHFMADDFLPGATIVVSYFLPFAESVAASNLNGREASAEWAQAYSVTNDVAATLNDHLVEVVNGMGHRAAVPKNIGLISRDVLLSRWSQRHVAWLAGHGAFGINNMLISEAGCCGRYFSIVTDLPATPDAAATRERCLYKLKGTCKACVRRCVAGALREDGFDRDKCYEMCLINEAAHPGADVCGKCDVGLPCSFRAPQSI